MSVFKKISCDGPRCTKESANHVYQIMPVINFACLLSGLTLNFNYIETNNVSDNIAAKHFCGIECALRYISEELGKMHYDSNKKNNNFPEITFA